MNRNINYKKKEAPPRKPKKRYTKQKGDDKLRNIDDATGDRISNDPNWYFSDSMLAEQVSRFSFNQFLGENFNLSSNFTATAFVPTIAKFALNPSLGWTDPTSPQRDGINTAGFKLYTTLSARNAKTTSYAPQDVTLLIASLGSLLTMISHMRRMFGITLAYNIRNRMYVRGLAAAMGLDFDDFTARRADYLAEFNYVLNTINKIAFPANIPYFEKCRSLFDNVYLDAESSMAQSYITVPHSVWVFDEAYSETGSGLRTVLVTNETDTAVKPFSEYLTILKNQIDALLNSTTLNYIYSDVLTLASKAEVKMFHIDLVPTDYAVLPLYSANFLLQLDNATIIGPPTASPDLTDGYHFTLGNDVISDANLNCVRYTPEFTAPVTIFGLDAIINFPTDTPDTTAIIEATRLTARADAIVKDNMYASTYVALPDFYITRGLIYGVDGTTAIAFKAASSAAVNVTASRVWATYAEHFSKMPRMYWYNGSSTDAQFTYFDRDTSYFTTVSKNYLKRVNDICYQGLFDLR